MKSIIRKQQRTAICGLTPEAKNKESNQLCQNVLNSELWRESETVLLYVPLPDEPDVIPLLLAAEKQSKKLFLPKFDPDIQAYKIAQIKNVQTDLLPGKFNIPEPITPFSEVKDINFALIPALAYDLKGTRLGRGKGYYDRLLGKINVTVKCGSCWSVSIVSKLPRMQYDIPVDYLVSPSGFVRI